MENEKKEPVYGDGLTKAEFNKKLGEKAALQRKKIESIIQKSKGKVLKK